MATVINGTDNTAATPALTGTDTDTGVFFPAANTMALSTGGTEKVRVDSAGNVGIGTNNPATKLVVSDTTGATIRINSTKDGTWTVGESFGALEFYGDDTSGPGPAPRAVIEAVSASTFGVSANLVFKTSGGVGAASECMRIDLAGNVLVGTTSNLSGDPRLLSQGTSGQTAFSCYRPTSTTTSNVFRVFSDVGGAATFNAQILANGNVQNTNNSYGSISDSKLKENIVDATPKLNQLCQVKIRNYNLIGYTTKQIGVVAQELEQIFPSMVEETSDTDSEGNDLGTTTKAVKYSIFVPMLIKAIQELKATVDAQAARIAALENPAAPTPVES